MDENKRLTQELNLYKKRLESVFLEGRVSVTNNSQSVEKERRHSDKVLSVKPVEDQNQVKQDNKPGNLADGVPYLLFSSLIFYRLTLSMDGEEALLTLKKKMSISAFFSKML